MADTSVIFNILARDNASSVFGKIGSSITGVFQGIGQAVGGAAMGGVSKAFDFAKDAVFGFNSTLQNSQIAFTTMLGSGQQAQAFLNQLQQFAKATPFEFEGLVKNAQNMMGMGIAAKDVIPDLRALGDSVASVGGSAEQVDQVTLAFDQMAAKGTLDMGNMNQLLQGGVPNALKILADSYHVTTGQMIQMISTGKVQSAEALPKLIDGLEHGTKSVAALGGMMDKQSQTFTGALSNISDGLTQAAAGAFRPFFNLASDGAQKLGNFFSSDTFTSFGNRVSSGISGAFSAAEKFAKGINYEPVKQAFSNVRDVVVNDLLPAGKSLLSTFGPLVKQAFEGAVGAIGPLSSALKPVGGALKDVFGFVDQHKTTFQAIGVAVLTVVGAMKAWTLATTVWSGVTKAATAVQVAFDAAMDANPIGLIILAIAALAAGFIYLWNHSAGFRNFWIGLWDGIKGAAVAVADWFSGPFANFFVRAGQMIAAPFVWLWHQVLEPAWNGIVAGANFVGNIISSFAHLWAFLWTNTVGAALLWLWHSVVEPAFQGVAAVASWVWNSVIKPVFGFWMDGVKAVGSAATWLWHNAIEPAFHGVAAVASWVWGNIISPTFNAIVGAAHWLGGVFSSVFHSISGWISSAFSGAASIVRGAMNGVIGVINGAIGGINSVINLANKVPGVSFPHLPTIPKLATGGTATSGGLAMVGEKGAEIVSLPTGSTVYPHGTGPGGGVVELRAAPGDQVAEALLSLLRPTVRGRYGGDVTAALGGAR